MRSRLSVRQHARLTGFVLTLGAALAFPRAITAQPQSPETPRAAEVVERVPLYFEPLPDGSFLARRIGRTIRISGADIRIARTPASGVEASGPIGIRFAGARRGLSVEGISQQRGRVNYLLGNDAGKWRTNVRTYARAHPGSLSRDRRRVLRGPGPVIEGSDEGLGDDIDVRQIAVSALNFSLMFTVGVRGLARSVDAGRHWTRVDVSAPSHEISDQSM